MLFYDGCMKWKQNPRPCHGCDTTQRDNGHFNCKAQKTDS